MKISSFLLNSLFVLTALCSETAYGGRHKNRRAKQRRHQQQAAEQARQQAEQYSTTKPLLTRSRRVENFSDIDQTVASLCHNLAAACRGFCPGRSESDSDDDDAAAAAAEPARNSYDDHNALRETPLGVLTLAPLYDATATRENAIDELLRAISGTESDHSTDDETASRPQAPVISPPSAPRPPQRTFVRPPQTPSMGSFIKHRDRFEARKSSPSSSTSRPSTSSSSSQSQLTQNFDESASPEEIVATLLSLMTEEVASCTRKTKYGYPYQTPAGTISADRSELFFELFSTREEGVVVEIVRQLFVAAQQTSTLHTASIAFNLNRLASKHPETTDLILGFFSRKDHSQLLESLLDLQTSDARRTNTTTLFQTLKSNVLLKHATRHRIDDIKALLKPRVTAYPSIFSSYP